MGDRLVTSVVTVLTAIIGVAIIATLVSKNANTSAVINAGAGGFAQALNAALSPINGNNSNIGGLSF